MREVETKFLRFWRALNRTNAVCGIEDMPLGRAWRLYRNLSQ